jgi:hypothetical protein
MPEITTPPAACPGILRLWPVLQFLRRQLPRLYFTRFPLLLAAFLVILVPLGLRWIPSMFRSTLIVDPGGIFAVALAATGASFAVMGARRVALLYGGLRFGMERPLTGTGLRPRAVAGYLTTAVPLLTSVVWLSATEGGVGWFAAAASALAGVAVGTVLMWVATLLQASVTASDEDLPEILLPRTGPTDAAQRRPSPKLSHLPWLRRLLGWARPLLGPGYLEPDRNTLLAGHAFQLALGIVFGGIYVLGHFAWRPGTAAGAGVPALVFLISTATVCTYALSGLAFFLDRHRVPVLLTLVAYNLVGWGFSRDDHYFAVEPVTTNWSLLQSPAEIAAGFQQPLLTVISVDGGGIGASAWAARVLTGIDERWPALHASVRFISAVSGGSVGTMYFVDALSPGRPPSSSDRARVRGLASRGSLNEVGWGVAYPDLWRLLLPIQGWNRFEDRGLALQAAWERDWRMPIARLSEWVPGVREGWRPAVSFAAVGAENGERFAFATFAPPDHWGLWTPLTAFGGGDVTVSTAARMSATFPYVSPLARAWPEPNVYKAHLADGGYYDNTGMGLAMRWIDEALRANASLYRGKVVAFVRLRSSPARAKVGHLLSHVTGPIETLMNVRIAAQQERAETELAFLQWFWCSAGVEIRSFEFAFENARAPLSWQLSAAEGLALERAWSDPDDPDGQRNRETLRLLLETAAAPAAVACP